MHEVISLADIELSAFNQVGNGQLQTLRNESTKVAQWEAQVPIVHAIDCCEHGLDDAANLLCGKALEEILCVAWLARHKAVFSDLLSGKITHIKRICDGKSCDHQPCLFNTRATLDGFIEWAKEQSLLMGKDVDEAEYVQEKRNDHAHAYALRLYGKTPAPAPVMGTDPQTPQTIERTIALTARVKSRLDSFAPTWT